MTAAARPAPHPTHARHDLRRHAGGGPGRRRPRDPQRAPRRPVAAGRSPGAGASPIWASTWSIWPSGWSAPPPSRRCAPGCSPSVRLFEAAACGTPVISDWWDGLDEFFVPGREIAVARAAAEALALLRGLPDDARRRMGALARERILAAHAAAHRADELERWLRVPDRPVGRPPRAGETAPPA